MIGLWMRRVCGILNAPLSHEAGCSIIKEAFLKGITFFDTADIYGHDHDYAIMISKALKQLPREQVQLATKNGSPDWRVVKVKGTPRYARECCEASLKRLDEDYIDLYHPHRVDTPVPIEYTESMGELKKLVEEGKIKYIGQSEACVDTIKRAHSVHPITAVLMEYSLWSHEVEEDVVPLCRELGIGIVAYSPLGRGFFGWKAVVERLPQERTTKVQNLINNIASAAVNLTHEDLKEIDDAVPVDEVGGEREIALLFSYCYRLAITPVNA